MTDTVMHYYETLGLEPSADAAAVKKAYFRLIRLHPPEKDPEHFQELRRAYEALKDGPPAEKKYNEDFPLTDNPTVLYLLDHAGKLFEQGNEKAAADCFREALNILPGDPFLLLNLARIQQRAGNPRKAARTAKQLQQVAPDYAEAYALAATGYYEGGWYKKAFPEFKKALALGYDERSFRIDYADVADKNGEHETALAQRAALLRDTKWDRDNIDEALYLFSAQLENCATGAEALPVLEEYGRFLTENRRILRGYGPGLLAPFVNAVINTALLSFHPFYKKADELAVMIAELAGDLDKDQLLDIRAGLLVFTLDQNPAFPRDWSIFIASAITSTTSDSRQDRYELLDPLLCLLMEREKNLPLLQVIRQDYPFGYEFIRPYCELFTQSKEGQLEKLKKEYARLSEQYEGGDFYLRYPEEKVQPRGVVSYKGDTPFVRAVKKPGRNDPCPCGSGLKFKRCCQGKGIYD